MSAEILNASLVETAEAIRTKKLSSVEVVQAAITRAEKTLCYIESGCWSDEK